MSACVMCLSSEGLLEGSLYSNYQGSCMVAYYNMLLTLIYQQEADTEANKVRW